MLPVFQALRILGDLLHPLFMPLAEGSPTVEVTVTTGVTPTPVATQVVEATATPATAVPVATPAPIPSLWSPGQWLHNTGWVSNFHVVFFVFFMLVAVAAIVCYSYLYQRRFKNHSLHAHLAERASYGLTAFATIGLLLLVFAVGHISFLSFPIWLIFSIVAFIAFVIYAGYFYASVYPVEIAKYDREQERARYIPKPRLKGPAYTPPMKKKQKQAKPAKRG